MNDTTGLSPDVTEPRPAHRQEDGVSQAIEGRKRLLITGSRTWPNQPAIPTAILQLWLGWGKPPLTLVHGGARGVDTMAGDAIDTQAAHNPELFKVEVHPALWDIHGRAAGHIRNAEMVALGADHLLAFIHNGSRGATGCLALAERAGIPTTVYRLDDGLTR